MSRVTPDEVRDIIVSSKTDEQILRHIDTANTTTNFHLSTSGLGESVLRLVELYLSAHFLAISNPEEGQVVRKEIEGTSDYYNADLGRGLESTRYGLTAISFDTTGTLKAVGKYRAQFSVETGAAIP